MYVSIALAVVFLAMLALLTSEGLWSNAIRFINVMLAALLATNHSEPLADFATSKMPTFTYVWDLISVWAIFGIVMMALQFITDKLSHIQVRFRKPVEAAGGVVFACWIGWIMVCFTAFTLHVAPMKRSFLGAFESPDDKLFFGLAPDQDWIALMHTLSLDGAWSKSRPANDETTNVFDPDGDFIFKYADSRNRFEHQAEIRTRGTR
jgi:hypothetical protein